MTRAVLVGDRRAKQASPLRCTPLRCGDASRYLDSRSNYRVASTTQGKEPPMAVMTGLSGNEMYCLHLKGLRPGDLVIGNSVFSMGVLGGIGAGVNTFLGGEVTQVTGIIHEGRQEAFKRMISEA